MNRKEKGMGGRFNLDIVGSAEVEARSEIKWAFEKGIVVVEIVVDGEVLGDEREVGLGELAFVVVLEGELHFGKAIQELTGDLMEEKGRLAIELRSETNGRPFG